MSLLFGITKECIRLRDQLQQVSDRYCGPLDSSAARNTKYPFVLLLGNHSSGKSSFINYVLNSPVQTTGVAPTDDNFTIIGYGEEDADRNGPALVGDPDLGFAGLNQFGPNLVHRTQLKLRSKIAVNQFMIVDSPGMIDSPMLLPQSQAAATAPGQPTSSSPSGRSNQMDRGYDFEGVCKWYAERADVILLFFDPDKPGTTGETLSILTNSLCQAGHDHKLHIILNKADQFLKIHDFARAYGSLCWNLSKVIHRKDLPQIHTMCIPQINHSTSSDGSYTGAGSSAGAAAALDQHKQQQQQQRNRLMSHTSEIQFLDEGFYDLEASRKEVIKEVFNAPKRRVDNEITRLADNAHLVLMHTRITDHLIQLYAQKWWEISPYSFFSWAITAGTVALAIETIRSQSHSSSRELSNNIIKSGGGGGSMIASMKSKDVLSFISSLQSLPVYYGASCLGALSFVTSLGLQYWQQRTLSLFADSLVSTPGLWRSFQTVYAREIVDKDEYVFSLWEKCRSRLELFVPTERLLDVVRCKKSPSSITTAAVGAGGAGAGAGGGMLSGLFAWNAVRSNLRKDLQHVKTIIDVDVASLRRQAVAPYFSAFTATGSSLTAAQGQADHQVAQRGMQRPHQLYDPISPEAALTANIVRSQLNDPGTIAEEAGPGPDCNESDPLLKASIEEPDASEVGINIDRSSIVGMSPEHFASKKRPILEGEGEEVREPGEDYGRFEVENIESDDDIVSV